MRLSRRAMVRRRWQARCRADVCHWGKDPRKQFPSFVSTNNEGNEENKKQSAVLYLIEPVVNLCIELLSHRTRVPALLRGILSKIKEGSSPQNRTLD